MRQSFIAAMLGVAALIAYSPAYAAKTSTAAAPAAFPKIAVIDLQAVITGCQRGREAMQLLQQKQNELQAQANDRSTKLNALKDQLDKADPKSSGYAALQKQFQDGQAEFQDFVNESRQLLQQRNQEALNPIQGELQTVLNQYVKERHIDILLTKAGAPYASEAYDVSTDVISAMDKDWAAIQKAAPAPTPAPAASTKH
ncbi:MAG: OmpH family outer membrane protein [Bacillota bacterium]